MLPLTRLFQTDLNDLAPAPGEDKETQCVRVGKKELTLTPLAKDRVWNTETSKGSTLNPVARTIKEWLVGTIPRLMHRNPLVFRILIMPYQDGKARTIRKRKNHKMKRNA